MSAGGDGLSTSVELPADFKAVLGAYSDALREKKKELRDVEREAKRVFKQTGDASGLQGRLTAARGAVTSLEDKKALVEAQRSAVSRTTDRLASIRSASRGGLSLENISRMAGSDISKRSPLLKAYRSASESIAKATNRASLGVASFAANNPLAVGALGIGAAATGGALIGVGIADRIRSAAAAAERERKQLADARKATATTLEEISFQSKINPGARGTFDINSLRKEAESAGALRKKQELNANYMRKVYSTISEIIPGGSGFFKTQAQRAEIAAETAGQLRGQKQFRIDQYKRKFGVRAARSLNTENIIAENGAELRQFFEEEYANISLVDKATSPYGGIETLALNRAADRVIDTRIERFEAQVAALARKTQSALYRITNKERSQQLSAQTEFEYGLFNSWNRF